MLVVGQSEDGLLCVRAAVPGMSTRRACFEARPTRVRAAGHRRRRRRRRWRRGGDGGGGGGGGGGGWWWRWRVVAAAAVAVVNESAQSSIADAQEVRVATVDEVRDAGQRLAKRVLVVAADRHAGGRGRLGVGAGRHLWHLLTKLCCLQSAERTYTDAKLGCRNANCRNATRPKRTQAHARRRVHARAGTQNVTATHGRNARYATGNKYETRVHSFVRPHIMKPPAGPY